jgi:hypothetical protein
MFPDSSVDSKTHLTICALVLPFFRHLGVLTPRMAKDHRVPRDGPRGFVGCHSSLIQKLQEVFCLEAAPGKEKQRTQQVHKPGEVMTQLVINSHHSAQVSREASSIFILNGPKKMAGRTCHAGHLLCCLSTTVPTFLDLTFPFFKNQATWFP